MLPSTEPPRGLRDVFPLDYLARERIFGAWRDAAALHGFLPYEAPVVESYELLARKAGEEITDQIYQFEDKSGRQLALRPEVTPSLVRMIAARPHEHLFPAKWTTVAQCFRYERTGKGRRREHYQWNLDVIGCPTVWAEAWILQCATAALRRTIVSFIGCSHSSLDDAPCRGDGRRRSSRRGTRDRERPVALW